MSDHLPLPEPAETKNAAPLLIHRSWPEIRNRHIVEARLVGQQSIVLLRVPDNQKFRPNTHVPPEDYEFREAGLYDFVGRRAPRD